MNTHDAGKWPGLFKRIQFLTAVALAVVFLDQLTKWLVVRHLTPYESVDVLGRYFRLTFIYNTGAIFGTDPLRRAGGAVNPRLFFCTLSFLAASAVVFLYFRTRPEERWTRLALALITGGAIGNFIDRARTGRVVDFVDWGINEHWRWAVFNVADSAVTVGITLVILVSLFGKKPVAGPTSPG